MVAFSYYDMRFVRMVFRYGIPYLNTNTTKRLIV